MPEANSEEDVATGSMDMAGGEVVNKNDLI
jgi:hypothetical protein